MCLLYFSLFKTVLIWDRKEMRKDGRGCLKVSCMAMPGIRWSRSSLQIAFGSIIPGTGEKFLEAEGY